MVPESFSPEFEITPAWQRLYSNYYNKALPLFANERQCSV